MRNNYNITIKAIITKINNNARCNNSIKTTTIIVKLENNSSNTG
jgi:hypothetical protein